MSVDLQYKIHSDVSVINSDLWLDRYTSHFRDLLNCEGSVVLRPLVTTKNYPYKYKLDCSDVYTKITLLILLPSQNQSPVGPNLKGGYKLTEVLRGIQRELPGLIDSNSRPPSPKDLFWQKLVVFETPRWRRSSVSSYGGTSTRGDSWFPLRDDSGRLHKST